MAAVPSTYAWVGDALADAACVTVVAGATAAEVLAAFRADTSVDLSHDDSFGGGAPYFASVAVQEVPGGVVAVELNGFQGSLEEVLSPMSGLGRAASIFWNVNDDNRFSCALDGRLVASVDMYDAGETEDVDLPDDLTPIFELAADDEVSMWAVGLAMVEQFTGVAVPEQAVRSAAPFHPVAEA